MGKENSIIRNIKKKLRTNGLLVALGTISLLGFLANTIYLLAGIDIFGTFAYASVILGIGLMIESRIASVLTVVSKKVEGAALMKLLTFVVGFFVFAGGLLTLPFFPFGLNQVITFMVTSANLLAIVVILYELFLVD